MRGRSRPQRGQLVRQIQDAVRAGSMNAVLAGFTRLRAVDETRYACETSPLDGRHLVVDQWADHRVVIRTFPPRAARSARQAAERENRLHADRCAQALAARVGLTCGDVIR
jgi:hypothetical protein